MASPHFREQRGHQLAFFMFLYWMKTFCFWVINALVMKQGIWMGGKKHHFTENNRHYLQPDTRPGRGFRKACKNQDWFTSLTPGLLQSRPTPYPTVGLQTAPEGWAVRAHEPQRGRELDCGKEKERRVNKHGRKERGEGGHKGSPGHSQSALCKQASSWSGQVAGGSPPRASGTVSRADNWWQECGICS